MSDNNKVYTNIVRILFIGTAAATGIAILLVSSWRVHLFNLLVHSWRNTLSANSSTNLSLALSALATPIITFAVSMAVYSRGHVMARIKKSLPPALIGLLVPLCLIFGIFVWHIPATIYDDHKALIAANNTLRAEKQKLMQDQNISEAEKKKRLDVRNKLSELLEQATNVKSLCLSHVPTFKCQAQINQVLAASLLYIDKNMEPSYRARFDAANGVYLNYENVSENERKLLSVLTYKAEVINEFIKESIDGKMQYKTVDK